MISRNACITYSQGIMVADAFGALEKAGQRPRDTVMCHVLDLKYSLKERCELLLMKVRHFKLRPGKCRRLRLEHPTRSQFHLPFLKIQLLPALMPLTAIDNDSLLTVPESCKSCYFQSDGGAPAYDWLRSFDKLEPFFQKNIFKNEDIRAQDHPSILHLGPGESVNVLRNQTGT